MEANNNQLLVELKSMEAIYKKEGQSKLNDLLRLHFDETVGSLKTHKTFVDQLLVTSFYDTKYSDISPYIETLNEIMGRAHKEGVNRHKSKCLLSSGEGILNIIAKSFNVVVDKRKSSLQFAWDSTTVVTLGISVLQETFQLYARRYSIQAAEESIGVVAELESEKFIALLSIWKEQISIIMRAIKDISDSIQDAKEMSLTEKEGSKKILEQLYNKRKMFSAKITSLLADIIAQYTLLLSFVKTPKEKYDLDALFNFDKQYKPSPMRQECGEIVEKVLEEIEKSTPFKLNLNKITSQVITPPAIKKLKTTLLVPHMSTIAKGIISVIGYLQDLCVLRSENCRTKNIVQFKDPNDVEDQLLMLKTGKVTHMLQRSVVVIPSIIATAANMTKAVLDINEKWYGIDKELRTNDGEISKIVFKIINLYVEIKPLLTKLQEQSQNLDEARDKYKKGLISNSAIDNDYQGVVLENYSTALEILDTKTTLLTEYFNCAIKLKKLSYVAIEKLSTLVLS